MLDGKKYDSWGTPVFFFSERINPELLSDIRLQDQGAVIQELEMLALLVAVSVWCPVFKSYGVVAFTYSESVRGAFFKTWSNNLNSSHLLTRIFQVEESSMCQVWLERPSQSNPVDGLSREETTSWMSLTRQTVHCRSVWHKSANYRGKSTTDI